MGGLAAVLVGRSGRGSRRPVLGLWRVLTVCGAAVMVSGTNLQAAGLLRPIADADIRVGSCDWGNCDEPTYAERLSEEQDWLEVCRRHAGKRGLILDPEET